LQIIVFCLKTETYQSSRGETLGICILCTKKKGYLGKIFVITRENSRVLCIRHNDVQFFFFYNGKSWLQICELVYGMAAHRALGLPQEPAVDARQVENVAAGRQPPCALAGLELLIRQEHHLVS
jgi:hypothetical protein